MKMQYGISAFERARGDLPGLPVVNMFAETAPTEADVVLQSRPNLSDRSADMGSGPVDALFKADGVLDSGLYGVSAGALYRGTSSLGSVDGSGPFSLAGYEDYLFVAGGGSLWSYDGVTLATVAFPDSATVVKVLVGASRLIALRSDTETFYWSDPLSTNIDALSFATAENQPDRLRDMLFIDDILILFGAETVEFWPNTGDSDQPFQPLEGRVFERGIRATGCATRFGTTFAWVTDQNQICLSDQDNIISNAGLEALIAASTACRLFTFFIEGTEFLAIRLDDSVWCYTARGGTFSQFESYGETNWLPQTYAGGVFGSAVDGKTYAWGTTHADPATILERRFRAGFPLNAGGVTVNNIVLRCNVGQTPYLSGSYADPTIEMRVSRDAGQTWGEWRRKSLGAQGRYKKKVQWTGCGLAAQPGLIAEFRVTDPVPLRISGVFVNEPFGAL